MKGVRQHHFFDAGYYKSNNPDLAALNGIELVEHFEDNGRFEGRSAASDYAGDSLTNPRNLTASPDYIAMLEHVGADDPVDYYRFDLNESSFVDFSVISLSRSIVGEVLDSSGIVVGNSISTTTTDPNPNSAYLADYYNVLDPGTYYLGIEPLSGNTDYGFELRVQPDLGFGLGISNFSIAYSGLINDYPGTPYGVVV